MGNSAVFYLTFSIFLKKIGSKDCQLNVSLGLENKEKVANRDLN